MSKHIYAVRRAVRLQQSARLLGLLALASTSSHDGRRPQPAELYDSVPSGMGSTYLSHSKVQIPYCCGCSGAPLSAALCRALLGCCTDQGYGRGGTPIFPGVFEPLARVALYPTDEDGLGTWFAAA